MNLLSRFTRPDYKDGEDFLAHYSYTARKTSTSPAMSSTNTPASPPIRWR